MARLQDFPSVTPTSSDKILIVQSQGQGLAPHTIKMDSANPSGTGTLSLNRASGSTVGAYSVAEGLSCTASGQRSHAEGSANTASGLGSHSEGGSNQAQGDYSHAEGNACVASGLISHAEGQGTIANHLCQHAFGRYNVADTSSALPTLAGNYIEIVGKGATDGTRSNARTLDWSGNEVLAGGLTINGTQPVGINQPIDKSSLSTSINEKASWDSAFSDLPTNFFGMVTIAFKSGYKASGLAIKTSSTYGSIFAIPNDNLNPYYYTVSGSTTTLHRLAYTS